MSLAVGPGVDAVQRHRLRGGHGEGLAIAFDLGQLEVLHALADRVLGFFDNDFRRSAVRLVFPPTAGGAQEPFEGLGEVGRVRRDEAHALLFDPALYPGHKLVLHLPVLLVAPPDQDIGAIEQLVTEALVRVVEAGLHNVPAFGLKRLQPFGNRRVDVVGIDLLGRGIHVGRALRPHHHQFPRRWGCKQVRLQKHAGSNGGADTYGCASRDAGVVIAGSRRIVLLHGAKGQDSSAWRQVHTPGIGTST